MNRLPATRPAGPPALGEGPPPAETGWWARAWRWCVRHPRWALLLLVAFQTLPVLGARDLYLGDELRHGSALTHVVNDGHALVLYMNGKPYPDKPPVWFWLVGAIAWVSGSTEPWVFFLAAAVAAAALALATLRLAREMGARDGPNLAPAVALTVAPLTALLSRTTRMDLLFAAFITLAATSLYRGLMRPGAGRSTVAAFAWAGVATWTKGPFGVVIPLATAVAFLAWRGNLKRLLRGDVLLGLGLFVLLLGLWALGVVLAEGSDFLASVLTGQVVQRFANATHHAEPFWFYVASLGPCVWPWCVLPLALPWRPSRASAWLKSAWATRRTGDPTRAWLGAWVLAGLFVLSVTSMKFFIYLAPLLPPLLILATQSLAHAPAPAQTRFWTIVGASIAVVALALPFAALAPGLGALRMFDLVPTAAALLAGALLTLALRKAAFGAVLLASTLGLATAVLVSSATLPPVLDPLLSPRGTGLRLQELAGRGYAPAAYGLYGGQLAYHTGRPVFETRLLDRDAAQPGTEALADFLAREPRAVVVLPEKRWARIHARFPDLVWAYQQQVWDGLLVLAVQEPPADRR